MAVKGEELTQRKASEMSTSSAVSAARVPSASAQQMYILKARDSVQVLKQELSAIALADDHEGKKESYKEAEDFVKSLLSMLQKGQVAPSTSLLSTLQHIVAIQKRSLEYLLKRLPLATFKAVAALHEQMWSTAIPDLYNARNKVESRMDQILHDELRVEMVQLCHKATALAVMRLKELERGTTREAIDLAEDCFEIYCPVIMPSISDILSHSSDAYLGWLDSAQHQIDVLHELTLSKLGRHYGRRLLTSQVLGSIWVRAPTYDISSDLLWISRALRPRREDSQGLDLREWDVRQEDYWHRFFQPFVHPSCDLETLDAAETKKRAEVVEGLVRKWVESGGNSLNALIRETIRSVGEIDETRPQVLVSSGVTFQLVDRKLPLFTGEAESYTKTTDTQVILDYNYLEFGFTEFEETRKPENKDGDFIKAHMPLNKLASADFKVQVAGHAVITLYFAAEDDEDANASGPILTAERPDGEPYPLGDDDIIAIEIRCSAGSVAHYRAGLADRGVLVSDHYVNQHSLGKEISAPILGPFKPKEQDGEEYHDVAPSSPASPPPEQEQEDKIDDGPRELSPLAEPKTLNDTNVTGTVAPAASVKGSPSSSELTSPSPSEESRAATQTGATVPSQGGDIRARTTPTPAPSDTNSGKGTPGSSTKFGPAQRKVKSAAQPAEKKKSDESQTKGKGNQSQAKSKIDDSQAKGRAKKDAQQQQTQKGNVPKGRGPGPATKKRAQLRGDVTDEDHDEAEVQSQTQVARRQPARKSKANAKKLKLQSSSQYENESHSEDGDDEKDGGPSVLAAKSKPRPPSMSNGAIEKATTSRGSGVAALLQQKRGARRVTAQLQNGSNDQGGDDAGDPSQSSTAQSLTIAATTKTKPEAAATKKKSATAPWMMTQTAQSIQQRQAEEAAAGEQIEWDARSDSERDPPAPPDHGDQMDVSALNMGSATEDEDDDKSREQRLRTPQSPTQAVLQRRAANAAASQPSPTATSRKQATTFDRDAAAGATAPPDLTVGPAATKNKKLRLSDVGEDDQTSPTAVSTRNATIDGDVVSMYLSTKEANTIKRARQLRASRKGASGGFAEPTATTTATAATRKRKAGGDSPGKKRQKVAREKTPEVKDHHDDVENKQHFPDADDDDLGRATWQHMRKGMRLVKSTLSPESNQDSGIGGIESDDDDPNLPLLRPHTRANATRQGAHEMEQAQKKALQLAEQQEKESIQKRCAAVGDKYERDIDDAQVRLDELTSYITSLQGRFNEMQAWRRRVFANLE